MRGVIGAQHVDDTLLDAVPDALAMIGRSHRGIHLGAGAKPLVAIGSHQCEVMRRCLAGRDVLVVAQEVDLLFGRDVKHVDPLAGFVRELYQALGRHQRRGFVAPHRMRSRVALYAQSLALIKAILVLGMEGSAASDHLQNLPQAFVVLHQ